MLSNAQEFNSIGGGPGIGYGGFGYGGPAWGGYGGGGCSGGGLGIGALGLFGLFGIGDLGRRRDGGGHGHDCCDEQGNLSVLAAIAGAKDATVGEGRAVLAAIAGARETTVAEGRGLLAAVAASREASAAQAYAAAIQASANTQSIKDQASAIAIVADKRFDDLALAGVTQTAAILARINQTEIDNLRDQLHVSRRQADTQEVNISIQNSNAQLQAQLQAQAQLQTQRDFDHIRRFDAVFGSFNQLNKSTQDVINFGTMAASANQANQQTNVK